jgi:hypothetical protein
MDWTQIPSDTTLTKTAEAIKARGITVITVPDKAAALANVRALIPKGAEVNNGSSTTLIEMGFVDYLKSGTHGWKNLHEEILKEKDSAKQGILRRKATSAEYFLGSVNAISSNGELVACDASGSRVTAYPFAAEHVVLVAGAQKITKDLEAAMRRVREYVFPLENERAQKAYGVGSAFGKWVIIERESVPNRITLILVREKLGF